MPLNTGTVYRRIYQKIMPLKITLKPFEKIIIAGAVVTNGKARSNLTIENKTPVLRQKDILTEKDADTPCRRIYLVVQLMYIDRKNLKSYHRTYWKLVRDLVDAVPSTLKWIDDISGHILAEQYYQALKMTKRLIQFEKEVVKSV